MAETVPSISDLREMKNALIGSRERKILAVEEGKLREMMGWVQGTKDVEALTQIGASVVAIAKEVPAAVPILLPHSASLLSAVQILYSSPLHAVQKVAVRLLDLLITLKAPISPETTLDLLSSSIQNPLLISLSVQTLHSTLKSPPFPSISLPTYRQILRKLHEMVQNSHFPVGLEAFIAVLAEGCKVFPELCGEIEGIGIDKALISLTRSNSMEVKMAALRLSAYIIQRNPFNTSLTVTITPTLASLCLSESLDSFDILSFISHENQSIQSILCERNFPVDFPVVLLRTDREEVRVKGIYCLACTINVMEEARLKVLGNDAFVTMMLSMLNSGEQGVVEVLELLFALSRATRCIKREIMEETVPSRLCSLLDSHDSRVQVLVLKILCNAMLDYDAFPVDVTELIGKSCEMVRRGETRLLALWLLKNLTFSDKTEVAVRVVENLELREVVGIVETGSPEEQLQALGILRNLLYPDGRDIESYLSPLYTDLFRVLEKVITTQQGEAASLAMYALVNLSCGAERVKMMIIEANLVQTVMKLLGRDEEDVRKAASEFMVNMCWREQFPEASERLRRLRDLGVESFLHLAESEFPQEQLLLVSRSNLSFPYCCLYKWEFGLGSTLTSSSTQR